MTVILVSISVLKVSFDRDLPLNLSNVSTCNAHPQLTSKDLWLTIDSRTSTISNRRKRQAFNSMFLIIRIQRIALRRSPLLTVIMTTSLEGRCSSKTSVISMWNHPVNTVPR